MQSLKHIKSFLFNYARYELSDGEGDEVVLQVNYKDNEYKVQPKTKIINKKFRAEIDEIANGLLSRKHGVNFANN